MREFPAFFAGRGMPSYEFVTVFFLTPAYLRAQRLAEARWERLVEAYDEHVDQLELLFGRHLREHYPAVRSHHEPGRLRYADEQNALELQIGEPVRRPLGWGGAALSGLHGGSPLRLPLREVFLTLVRGRDPEWVSPLRGFPAHRLAVVNDTVVSHLCGLVFGAPANQSAGFEPGPR